MYITNLETPWGLWEICGTEDGVARVLPVEVPGTGAENPWTCQAARELREYWEGKRTSFTVPLAPQGTAFQQAVWKKLTEIPFGETRCYSQIAEAIGKPTACRAAAQAIGKNPCLIFIPCHRVLGKDGSLTGFSAGLELKKSLLTLEMIAWS